LRANTAGSRGQKNPDTRLFRLKNAIEINAIGTGSKTLALQLVFGVSHDLVRGLNAELLNSALLYAITQYQQPAQLRTQTTQTPLSTVLANVFRRIVIGLCLHQRVLRGIRQRLHCCNHIRVGLQWHVQGNR
jgi:hypothetical protein